MWLSLISRSLLSFDNVSVLDVRLLVKAGYFDIASSTASCIFIFVIIMAFLY